MLDPGFRLRGRVKIVSSSPGMPTPQPIGGATQGGETSHRLGVLPPTQGAHSTMCPWSRETLGSRGVSRQKQLLFLNVDSTRGTAAGGQADEAGRPSENGVPSRMPPLRKAADASLAGNAQVDTLRLSAANSTTNTRKSVRMIGLCVYVYIFPPLFLERS